MRKTVIYVDPIVGAELSRMAAAQHIDVNRLATLQLRRLIRDVEEFGFAKCIGIELETVRAPLELVDPLEELIIPYLRANAAVRIPGILRDVLKLSAEQVNNHTAQRRVAKILRAHGYHNTVRRTESGVIREWRRPVTFTTEG